MSFFSSLLEAQPPAATRRELDQARVRLAVSHAHALYRRYQHDLAERLLRRCRECVRKRIATKTFPCFGTSGEIAYALGRIYRQQQQFGNALREFNCAVGFYNARADWKRRQFGTGAAVEAAFSAHKVANIAAMGACWCNYTQGALSTALYANLIPARMYLRNTQDVLNRAYVDVIYASILRALTRGDAAALRSARVLVRKAKVVFENHGHHHYAAGAALELALISLAQKDTPEALKAISSVWKHAGREDFRWACSAMIVESRIHRHLGEYLKAEQSASEAFDLAEKQREPLARMDSLIARSEAYSRQKKHDLAVADLGKCLSLNRTAGRGAWPSNPKVHAICNLHLVQNFLALNRTFDAMASFREWERVAQLVEHARIHQLASQMEQALDRTSIFVIDANTAQLNYYENDQRLRRFLLKQATSRSRTQHEIAQLLGISRQSIPDWLQAGQKPRPARVMSKRTTKIVKS